MDKIEIKTPTKLSDLDSILIEMADAINYLLEATSALRSDVNRCEKKYPPVREMNPYDLSQVGRVYRR